jgi:tetratricopeptide (TPR) repeat protein
MVAAWVRVLLGVFSFPLTLASLNILTGQGRATAWMLYNFAVWPLVLFVSVAVHELGHAGAGRVLGFKPRTIFLGVGRELTRWRLGSIDVRLNAFPLLGMTMVEPKGERALRLRAFAVFAAGPAATAALLLFLLLGVRADGSLALLALPTGPITHEPAAWQLAVLANVMMLGINLLPLSFSAGFRSDGALLLSIPWMRERQLKDLLITHLVLDAMEALERHDLATAARAVEEALGRNPGSLVARTMSATIDMEQGRPAEARAALVALLAQHDALTKHERLQINNNLAWANFLIGDEALVEEADRLSEEVVREFGSAAFALGTRGAVLLWRGRAAEACGLLERAQLTNHSPWGSALNACCLALAYAKRGDPKRALTWLEEAKRADPGCSLLPRAIAAMRAGE